MRSSDQRSQALYENFSDCYFGFLFILVNNWFGILPLGGFGPGRKGEHGLAFIPFFRGGTADINTTIALATMAVIGANIFGIFRLGYGKLLINMLI